MLSRIILSLIPLLLTPLILWAVNNAGSDKAPILIIPWFLFCIIYAITFNLLFKHFTARAILFVVTVFVSIVASYVLALALLYAMSWYSGG